jgi:hypothetical protein
MLNWKHKSKQGHKNSWQNSVMAVTQIHNMLILNFCEIILKICMQTLNIIKEKSWLSRNIFSESQTSWLTP